MNIIIVASSKMIKKKLNSFQCVPSIMQKI